MVQEAPAASDEPQLGAVVGNVPLVIRANALGVMVIAGNVNPAVPLLVSTRSRVVVPVFVATFWNESGAGLATTFGELDCWNSTAPMSARFVVLSARGLPKKSLATVAGSGSPPLSMQPSAAPPSVQLLAPLLRAGDVPGMEYAPSAEPGPAEATISSGAAVAGRFSVSG